LANRLIGKRVGAAAVGFAQAAQYFRNAVVTGVPVRQAIFEVRPKAPGSAPRLLVTAGSQGAKILNETMPMISAQLLERVPRLTILHQAGPKNVDATRAAYGASGADRDHWEVRAFIDDMPVQYGLCDLVLARSGSTVAELAAAGKPSVLVPLPTAADDHQRKNAEVFAEAGAAVMLLQPQLTAEILLDTLARLLNDSTALTTMGTKARTLAKPGALEKIGELIVGLKKK
jgi:UDP-N-acetylglucosamine--N-acetylmuramyl-(pentapeptide) pyrophosphoryl-undecaprenol N-acetylglucosamine transferase